MSQKGLPMEGSNQQGCSVKCCRVKVVETIALRPSAMVGTSILWGPKSHIEYYGCSIEYLSV